MKIKQLREFIRCELAHRRWVYALFCGLVITLGLFWRSRFVSMPPFLGKYGGDALWALAVYLGFGFLNPKSKPLSRALLAIVFSCLVEFSQLYHGVWIEALRGTGFGLLVLGRTFNGPDMIAYGFGVFYGLAVESLYRHRLVRVPKPKPTAAFRRLPRKGKRARHF